MSDRIQESLKRVRIKLKNYAQSVGKAVDAIGSPGKVVDEIEPTSREEFTKEAVKRDVEMTKHYLSKPFKEDDYLR